MFLKFLIYVLIFEAYALCMLMKLWINNPAGPKVMVSVDFWVPLHFSLSATSTPHTLQPPVHPHPLGLGNSQALYKSQATVDLLHADW